MKNKRKFIKQIICLMAKTVRLHMLNQQVRYDEPNIEDWED
jgi:hypothetical protein